jgi:peptidoglycan/xylan/chitin deacetylase (PgdA/CDA1 family)
MRIPAEIRRAVEAVPSMPIPVLLYHSVSNRPDPAIREYTVTPFQFRRQLDLIVDARLTPLTVSELAARTAAGSGYPSRPIVITFDDGYRDTLETAAPELAARGLSATVYLTTGPLRGRWSSNSRLSWQDLGDLEAAGLEIGSHSHSHPELDVLPRRLASLEIRSSRERLEHWLGHPVASFAYPHGFSDAWVRSEVRAQGFDSACAVRNAFSHPGDDRWRISRLTLRPRTSIATFRSWLAGLGAPVADAGEALQVGLWRTVRRLRRPAPEAEGWGGLRS